VAGCWSYGGLEAEELSLGSWPTELAVLDAAAPIFALEDDSPSPAEPDSMMSGQDELTSCVASFPSSEPDPTFGRSEEPEAELICRLLSVQKLRTTIDLDKRRESESDIGLHWLSGHVSFVSLKEAGYSTQCNNLCWVFHVGAEFQGEGRAVPIQSYSRLF
jgi:hypothetical protein